MQGRVVFRDEIERALASVDLVSAMKEAFVAYSAGRAVVPPVGELLFEDPPGEAHIKYGYVRGDDIFVVKVATGFYANPDRGLPPNSGLMLVFDRGTGIVSAILLDEGMLTDQRTAAAGALAGGLLAPPRVEAIGILGSGVQARLQAMHLKAVTECRQVVLWARRQDAAAECGAYLKDQGFSVSLAGSPAEVARSANLVVTATAATEPLLEVSDLRPGMHITAVGSDTPDKQELSLDLLLQADVLVADSLPQCRERGELHRGLKSGAVAEADVKELGAILAGTSPGRTEAAQVTIADLTGVAVQDIAICKAVLAGLPRLSAEAAIGVVVVL